MIITYFPSHCNTHGELLTEFECWGVCTGNGGAVILMTAHLLAVQNMTEVYRLRNTNFSALLEGRAQSRRNECGKEGGKVRGWKMSLLY